MGKMNEELRLQVCMLNSHKDLAIAVSVLINLRMLRSDPRTIPPIAEITGKQGRGRREGQHGENKRYDV
jgi:hypothetical protein